MMIGDVGRAAVLGVVQGLTEFLPISSSGHLILVPKLLRWPDFGLSFDVALHLGTLAALLIYFAPDWARMARGFLPTSRGVTAAERRLVWLIALGTVPAVIIGVLIKDWTETVPRQYPILVALPLILVALAMWGADRLCKHVRALETASVRDALLVGCAQALALVPGVSRSGATITAGMVLGFRREDAARFSFLLSAPVTLGAALYKLRDLLREGLPPHLQLVFVVGVLTSALVGYLCIAFLLAYLRRRSLLVFVVYRLALGAVLLAVFWPRG